MKNFFLGVVLAGGIAVGAFVLVQKLWPKPSSAPLVLNQNIIQGIATTLNWEDPLEVFRYVFLGVPERPIVYPTENYYYYQIYAGGRTIWGNLRFDVKDRDQGVLHIGYFEYSEDGQFQDFGGHSKALGRTDGVEITKLDAWRYKVKAFGRQVVFTLNDLGWAIPQKAKLRAGEEYVGTLYDESGDKFFLLYNGADPHLFYVLNEDEGSPEDFAPVDSTVSPWVVVGKRTGFMFYQDQEYSRKILIGVNAGNMQKNNYYDGPFDQLPDNYVEKTQMKKYMSLAYPGLESQIDQYGVFVDQEGSRMAVTPYYSYYTQEEFSFVESCRQTYPTPEEAAKFISCITPEER